MPDSASTASTTMLAVATRIMQPLLRACITSPHRDISRRLLKYTEELGEVAGCYNDLTGSNYKGLTAQDLLEEKIDLFVVATDTLMRYHIISGGDAPEVLGQELTQELADMLEQCAGQAPDDTAKLLMEVTTELGRAMLDLQTCAPDLVRLRLAGLHSATLRLLLTPESSPAGMHRRRVFLGRLPALETTLGKKLAKWESNRTLPKAA